ncbi:MAG: hypothetical protein Q4B54_04820 [Coriobacteriales bacterium]|nr:hypothetical protein [Coriobacteriales bacterium]
MIVAALCIMLIEALHGHECSGDGCIFCLATAWAQALLLLCAGISVARPVIRVLARVRFVCLSLLRACIACGKVTAKKTHSLPHPTPFALGVLLRI